MGARRGGNVFRPPRCHSGGLKTNLHSSRAGLKMFPDLSEVGLGRESGWSTEAWGASLLWAMDREGHDL